MQMQFFDSDGVQIAYRDEGAGEPVLLIHGFASNSKVNWVDPGWMQTLTDAGYRAIAIDNRGHGESEKLYDEAAYGAPLMAEDARRLLDHLGIAKAHVLGYSMGARIGSFLAINHPDRVKSLVISGMGINLVRGVGGAKPIAAALEADSPDEVKDDAARSFRLFADQTGSDRHALAACIRSSREPITAEALAGVSVPILIAVGTDDVVAGSASELAALLPGAQVLDIPKRDHMRAVGDPVHKKGVLEFLAEQRRA
ncbi:pimeloyl-ACP methyl ester carboxylesterase [Dichotomicrobium thermohalophilum]|uniref:Pimeloyl-ACP methyl ester carboxylesterase n=2 Tax=Dichotomicrobium thermohalophilum TaxID=933063 RepID=A0A397Q2N5_9HYPH|nr:pimeloyl-ACP methyl ester carboxylesterase [Dichotomicrobium thermohalophilum]